MDRDRTEIERILAERRDASDQAAGEHDAAIALRTKTPEEALQDGFLLTAPNAYRRGWRKVVHRAIDAAEAAQRKVA